MRRKIENKLDFVFYETTNSRSRTQIFALITFRTKENDTEYGYNKWVKTKISIS